MVKKLEMPKVVSTEQAATVNIPFKLYIHNIRDPEPVLESAVPWFNRRFFKTEKITVPWRARGTIRFFDSTHGYIDHGHFVEVEMIGQFVGPWWITPCWKRLNLEGILPNIGRYCFTGWGICEMEIYNVQDNTTVFHIVGRVETEIVK